MNTLVFRLKAGPCGMRNQFEVAQVAQVFFLTLGSEYAGRTEAIRKDHANLLDQLRPLMAEANVEVASPAWFAELFPKKKS